MSAAPNPSTLLLWGAVGIGAYFVLTRMGVAQAAAAQGQLDASKNFRDASYASAVSNALGGIFGNRGPATSWSTGGGAWNNPSAYVAPSLSFPDYGAPSGATGAWL